jgi:site-specific recombinase XerD
MNRRPLGLKLDKALTGFLQHKAAEALSPNTLIAYEHDLKLWIKYAGDVDVCQVTTQNLRAFLAWLRTDYNRIGSLAASIPSLPKPSTTSGSPCRLSSPGRPPNSRCPIR